jgi:hypothetical protein
VLQLSDTVAGTQASERKDLKALLETKRSYLQFALYALALFSSISLWFIAIHAPLWLDETISYWQIHAGFGQISSRQGLSFGAYSYVLWFATKIFGTSEIALRIPEILAMLGAVYLLYRAARDLFDQDVAFIAAVLFCLHPLVVFASIDVRPYAFGALAINAAILCLTRLRNNHSNWLAALFGVCSACIVYFQFLFVVMLPALAIGFFLLKTGDRKTLWRQCGVALTAFVLAFLPVIPGLQYMFHTSGNHVFDDAPKLSDLAQTVAPWRLLFTFMGAALIAAVTRRLELPTHSGRRILLCASLGLIPILILYGVSAETSIHVFVPRYRLVAVPGLMLCWAMFVSLINSRAIRMLFCIVLVAAVAYHCYTDPLSKLHGISFKDALEIAEQNASVDNAPVLICSDLPESNYVPMPLGDAVKDSTLFAPLTYYKLSVPVVGLPRALNDEAVQLGSSFLLDATRRRQRFLAVGFEASFPTLYWLENSASGSYDVRLLKEPYGVAVLEFTPRTQ